MHAEHSVLRHLSLAVVVVAWIEELHGDCLWQLSLQLEEHHCRYLQSLERSAELTLEHPLRLYRTHLIPTSSPCNRALRVSGNFPTSVEPGNVG